MKYVALIMACLLMMLPLVSCKKPAKKDPATTSTTSTTEKASVETTADGNIQEGTATQNHTQAPGTSTKKKNTTTTTTKKKGTTTTEGIGNDGFDWGETTTLKGNKPTTTTTTTTTTAVHTTSTTRSPAGTPVFPKAGDRLYVSSTGDLLVVSATINRGKGTGTLVLKNTSKTYETEQGATYLVYTCYDKNGKKLEDVRINVDRIHKQQQKTLSFTFPTNTQQMRLKEAAVIWYTDDFH